MKKKVSINVVWIGKVLQRNATNERDPFPMSSDRKYHFALCAILLFSNLKCHKISLFCLGFSSCPIFTAQFPFCCWDTLVINLEMSLDYLHFLFSFFFLSFFPSFPKRPVTLSYSNLVKEDLAYPSVLPFFSLPSIKLSKKKKQVFSFLLTTFKTYFEPKVINIIHRSGLVMSFQNKAFTFFLIYFNSWIRDAFLRF